MTVNKNLEITCNECYKTKTWDLSVLEHQTLKSVLRNSGFSVDHNGMLQGDSHFCANCNDREKDTFYVVGGHGESYLGEVDAWGIVDARRVAWDTFECENMVKREKEDAIP